MAGALFGIKTKMKVPALQKGERTRCRRSIFPPIASTRDTTIGDFWRAFAYNRRVMIQGYHGTGKSTHIEQVAGAAELALHPHQSGFAHQPYRFDRQGTPLS